MTATFQYFPFNNQDVYQDQWVEMMSWMRSTGIVTPNLTLEPATGDLAVTAPGGMQVAVAVGQAFMEGTFFIQEDDYNYLPITANNDPDGYDRIDLVVLSTDYTAMTTTEIVLEGTPAMSPVAPTPTQVQNVLWQLPLARVFVTNGAVNIVTGNITDERVKSVQDGGGVSLTSDGTMSSQSLVAEAIGPNLAVFGLAEGSNITISESMGDITIAGASCFLSTEKTGTGMAQVIPHGLPSAPFSVLVVPTDTTNAGIIAGGFTTSYTADATNVTVTATSNLKYFVQAWAN